MNRTVLTLLFLLLSIGLFAQQAPMFSQNMFTYTAINPGTYAMDDAINALGLMRQQWSGFTDTEGNNVAPQTFLASVSSPVEVLDGGLGLNLIKDQLGYFKDVGLSLGYSHNIDFLKGELGIGASVNLMNRKIDFSGFDPLQSGDPVLENTEETSDMMIDFSLGLFYRVPNQYYIGFSVANILESKGKSFSASTDIGPKLDRTIYLMAGYDIVLPRKPLLKITPSVLVKSNFSNTQISLSGIATYNNKFWGGVTYNVQTADALAFMVGLFIKDLKIGYAYDLPMSSINSGGSHEVMMAYRFKLSLKKKKDSYRNTRFL